MELQPRLQLVTGPARSGKSRWAEHLAGRHAGPVTYIATAPARVEDQAWQERLQAHRLRRPDSWRLLELQAGLAGALLRQPPSQLALIDALGNWVAWGLERPEPAWRHCREELLDALRCCPGSVIVVSEQTGWGVVPPTAIGGQFRDRLGALEQEVAALCERSWLVVAGRALDLTALAQPVPR